MKRLILLTFILSLTAGCGTRIPPGYVGIKIDMYGSSKGVQNLPLVTGQVWYNPFTEEVHKYPTFMQNVVWTENVNEGKNGVDEAMLLSSIEGTTLKCDVGVNYSFIPALVPSIYMKFRQDPAVITDTYIRTQVRNVFLKHTTKMKVMDIMGPGQSQLFTDVLVDLNKELNPKGFSFDMVTFVSKPRASAEVEASINATIEATQSAIKAENTVRQSKAEAEQAIAEAHGQAASILEVADAQAEANKRLNASLTPTLVQWNAVQKWNGTLPTFTGGGAIPFINAGLSK